MKNGIILFFLLIMSVANAQNQLFKGNNLLLPSNLIVNYAVQLDSCYKMVDGECKEPKSKAYLTNYIENNLFQIMLENAFSGKVNFYKTDSWVTYQLMENKKQIPISKAMEELGETFEQTINTQELVGLNFIEEWKVTDYPFAFEKKVIAFMPIRRYFSEKDLAFENPLFKFPFAIIDTITKKSKIRRSNRRMILTNEIASEYFIYMDYTPPYDLDPLMEMNDQSTQNLGSHLLNKETSEYLSKSGVFNFLKTIVNKAITGELRAYNYYNNQTFTASEVEKEMGAYTILVEDNSVTVPSLIEKTIPMDLGEIQSLIFLEKWYIDPITLRMRKKVIGVAPVRFYYLDDDEYQQNLIRKILFKVYFDEEDRF